MAVGPKDAVKLDPEDIDEVEQLEREIDTSLRRKYQGSGYVCFSLKQKVRSNVQKELIQRYKKAGWKKVEFKSNQREGEWIHFE